MWKLDENRRQKKLKVRRAVDSVQCDGGKLKTDAKMFCIGRGLK